MSGTQTPVPAPPVSAGRAHSRWRQHWHRAVVPFAVLAALVTVTLVAHQLEEPNLRDPGTLSPTGTGPDGSSRLAQLLSDRGVTVDRAVSLDEALAAVETGEDAVVFVPAPEFVSAHVTPIVATLPGRHRVVLVAPGGAHLSFAGVPVAAGPRRWASQAVAPGCDVPEAAGAGRAAALRSRYEVATTGGTCYRGGLVRTGSGGAEVFVIGATDPFRNSRIDERGNADLAVGLLAARERVVWLDVHDLDLDIAPRFALPEFERPTRSERDRTGGGGLGFTSLVAGYPPGVLVGLSLVALLALLVALARARRLGPPVSEPLPVLVPAAEAVAGRGRLYQRGHGRGVALEALRAASLNRILPVLGLAAAPPPDPATVIAAVAARTGLPSDHVRRTLYGLAPDTDQDLRHAVAALDELVEIVTTDDPRSRGDAP